MNKTNNLFYYWLIFTFGLVFLMLIVGGLTRLTGSGLSITEWELFTGILPPLSDSKWNYYFDLYKEIPQYKLLNYNMNLEEFKVIYYWEYFHRLLGRVIGLFFMLPLIYFYLTKKIDQRYLSICLTILLLIVFQGAVGWYMVSSGLTNNIHVSHYRLALHLSVAFIILNLIFWTILNLQKKTLSNFFINKKTNFLFYFLIFLIFMQIVLGAFVSGLDAGRLYQTWPLMNLSFFPDDVKIYSISDLINFNNQSLVQFYHRNMAYIITIYILFIGCFIFIKKMYKLFKSYLLLFSFLIIQIILGIFTLVSGINIYLASAHQICSLLLMLSVLNLYYKYVN